MFIAVLTFVAGPMRLGGFNGFVEAFCSALIAVNGVTAVLLWRHAYRCNRASLATLSAGFSFVAVTTFIYMLADMGVLYPGEARAPLAAQMINWLWRIWHIGMPLAVIAYDVLERRDVRNFSSVRLLAIGAPTAALWVGGVVWVMAPYLPPLNLYGVYQPIALHVVIPLLLVITMWALLQLWQRRSGTLLDLWLQVTLVATLLEIVASIPGSLRLSLGWYVSKLDTLFAGSLVLFVLLTETDRLMQTVALGERRMRSIVEGVADALISVDHHERITSFNPAAERLFGYRIDDVYQRVIVDLIPHFNEAWLQRMRGDEVETEARNAAGYSFPIEMEVGQQPSSREWIVIVRDVTQRKRAEAAIREARDRAIEMANAKARFLATMSHEIRTPINAVVGMSELMLQCELTEEAQDYARTVRDSADSLLAVINDILDFSKIEAGKMEIDLRPFSLTAVIEGAADICAGKAREKGLSIATYVAPEIPAAVMGDGARVRQILLNLIGNAAKFTDKGFVVVRASAEPLDAGRVNVRIAVEDSGPGISPEQVTKLCEAFHRGDATTRSRHGGTGLGLSISKRLIEMMGGALSIESKLGVGSVFSFTMPFEITEAEGTQAMRMLTDARILIFDEDLTSLAIVEDYAHTWGIDTTSTDNPAHALALMKAAHARGAAFDAVLVDHVLPGEDAYELAERVRAEPALTATPLILYTAHDEPGRGAEAIRRGFSAYLRKPLRQSTLFDALANAVHPAEAIATPSAPAHPERQVHEDALILVAEDNPVNRKVALHQLRKLGFRAHTVENGAEAVAAAAQGTYDIILMDCQMPELDGFEATRAIRRAELHTGAHIPIVAMTANALEGERNVCLAAGMDDYLSKPVQLLELRAMLERFLPLPENDRLTSASAQG
ncbi:MAG TPA: response regulator [Candidatus Acidoferrales bacterium]|nr:response regulator [Candidatus Acidoferrales bacterium]